jgi:hypothetical protein
MATHRLRNRNGFTSLSLRPLPVGSTRFEIWFGILTRKVVRHGIFKSRKEVIERPLNFTEAYNKEARPLEWTYTANPLAT